MYQVSFLGSIEVGTTGFRFARIDLIGEETTLQIKSIRASCIYRDLAYRGHFSCNDALINQIWDTAAYTVHLNMQDYLWDGIKRDRLPWIGDMYTEIHTIQTLFGYDEIVPKALDLIRDETPLPGWMNGIPSYSMWWILIQANWYEHHGDRVYLMQQKPYLIQLLDQLAQYVGDDGQDTTPQMRFLDWPSHDNKEAVDAGLQALHILAVEKGAKLCEVLGERKTYNNCQKQLEELRKYTPHHSQSKQAAALMAWAKIESAQKLNEEVLQKGGAQGLSTFMGYYILKAMGMAGYVTEALACIRAYWGGMLSLGATTFWEDFDLAWLENAGRIDEIVPKDKIDVHGQYGKYCYKGYRHSLCHGWAAGPVPWLTEYVLGIKIQEVGCKRIKIEPHLGDLKWVSGTFPTPFGVILIQHEKMKNGEIKTHVEAPKEVIVE